jgi:hypothetical protein
VPYRAFSGDLRIATVARAQEAKKLGNRVVEEGAISDLLQLPVRAFFKKLTSPLVAEVK